MRSSVFKRPAEVHFITLHEDLYRICRGSACAAMLMDYFIREHDRGLWEIRKREDELDAGETLPESVRKWQTVQAASVEFLCEVLVWCYSKNTVSQAMSRLFEWGMIREVTDRPRGMRHDRRHYFTVDQQVVQALFDDLCAGIAPAPLERKKQESAGTHESQQTISQNRELHLPNLGNGFTKIGKSVTKGNEGIEKIEPAGKPAGNLQKKVRARDQIVDQLVIESGGSIEEATDKECKAAGIAAASIRKACPNVTVDDIRARASVYRQKFSFAALTPMAIAGKWSQLAPPKAHGSAHATESAHARRQEIAEQAVAPEVDPELAAEFFSHLNESTE